MTLPAPTTRRATPHGETPNNHSETDHRTTPLVHRGKTTTATTDVHNDMKFVDPAPESSGYKPSGSFGAYAQYRESLALQRAGYEVAGKRGDVKRCGTIPFAHGKVALGTKGKSIQVSGLSRCGNRWCPECRAKVARHKSEEVAEAVAWAWERGLIVVMYTLTGSHVTTEELEDAGGALHEAVQGVPAKMVRKRMSKAWRAATTGKRNKVLQAGRVGTITAQEVTVDDLMIATSLTGIHWHRHVLVFLEPVKGKTALEVAGAYGETLFGYWQAGAESVNLTADRKGFHMALAADQEEASDLGRYVSKCDVEKIHLEATRAETKSGRGKRRAVPEQVLRYIGHLQQIDPTSRKLARLIAQWKGTEEGEYQDGLEAGTKGTHWLRWSPGLRELVGLDKELTDEEIANTEETPDSEQVAVVSWEEIQEHVAELRRVIREAEDGQEWATLVFCLDSLGIDYQLVTQEEWGKRMRVSVNGFRAGRGKDRERTWKDFQPQD